MVLKDTSQIINPLVLRGVAQGVCLFIGIMWIITHLKIVILLKYWPVFGYLFISIISGIFSPRIEHALLQSASLIAICLFFIAFFEIQSKKKIDSYNLYFNTTIILYAVVCLISILLIKLNYSYVYGRVGNWFDPTVGMRFRGLFAAAGIMAAVSGLLIGLALFKDGKLWWRIPVFFFGFVCLALTQSRTFWVSTFIATVTTLWIYKPRLKAVLVVAVLSSSLILSLIVMTGLSIDTKNIEEVTRSDSISNLSGRTKLWDEAIDRFTESPLIGYGSTIGSYALRGSADKNTFNLGKITDRSLSRDTLHNGYLQAILDLGFLGFVFYILIFVIALKRLLTYDRIDSYATVFYIIVFMAIGNLGESIIYSASVSHSIIFWCAVILALSGLSTSAKKFKKLVG